MWAPRDEGAGQGSAIRSGAIPARGPGPTVGELASSTGHGLLIPVSDPADCQCLWAIPPARRRTVGNAGGRAAVAEGARARGAGPFGSVPLAMRACDGTGSVAAAVARLDAHRV
jgi:hypothetical protein